MKKRLLAWVLSFALALSLLPVGVLAAGSTVASGTCGDNLTWVLDSEGTLTISGEGEMDNYDSSATPWTYPYYCHDQIKSLVIEPGVTSVGAWAFAICENLTKVTLPNTITSISDYAFSDCNNLKDITIPDSVKYIGSFAFSATNIEEITIPYGITKIEDGTFRYCNNLKKVNIPNSVKSIHNAFYNCENLTTIQLPDSVESITGQAFSGCSNLESIRMPSTLNAYTFDMGTFNDCSSLKAIVIPDGVKVIPGEMFLNCSSLEQISIPNSVVQILIDAFKGCDNLSSVYYGGSEEQWNAINITEDGNEKLLAAKIHYNNGASSSDSDAQYILAKFTGYDDATKQVSLETDSSVFKYWTTDQTDMSFANDLNALKGKYVLVQYLSGDYATDFSSRYVLSISSAVVAVGKLDEVTETSITINGKEYPMQLSDWANQSYLLQSSIGKFVVGYVLNNTVVDVRIPEEQTGTLESGTADVATIDGKQYMMLEEIPPYLPAPDLWFGKTVSFLAVGNIIFQMSLQPISDQYTKKLVSYDAASRDETFHDGSLFYISDGLTFDQALINRWVTFTVETSAGGKEITQIEVAKPEVDVSFMVENKTIYTKGNKYSYNGTDYKDGSDFKIHYGISVSVTFPNANRSDYELMKSDPSLAVAINYLSTTAPEGFLGSGNVEDIDVGPVYPGKVYNAYGVISPDDDFRLGNDISRTEKSIICVVGISDGTHVTKSDSFEIINQDYSSSNEPGDIEFTDWEKDLLREFYKAKDVDVTVTPGEFDLYTYFDDDVVEDIGKTVAVWETALTSGLADKTKDAPPPCLKITASMNQKNDRHRATLVFYRKDYSPGIPSTSLSKISYVMKDNKTGRVCISDGTFSFSAGADFSEFANGVKTYLKKELGNDVLSFFKKVSKDTAVQAVSAFANITGRQYINTVLGVLKDFEHYKGYIDKAQAIIQNPIQAEAATLRDFNTITAKHASIHCPVDIFVYNSENQLCGKIEGDTVTYTTHDVFLYVENGQKSIWMNGDYYLKLNATDTGTMDYTVTEYESAEETRSVVFEDVPLRKGLSYTAECPEKFDVPAEEYVLTASTGEKIYATSDTNEDRVYTVSIFPNISHGTLTASPTSAKQGDTITLTTTPNSGYRLASLTVTDEAGNPVSLTSTGNGTYTFTMPASAVTASAAFTAIPQQPEDPDTPEQPAEPFTDVDETDWFYDEVVYVYENGLMNGVENNQFAPNTATNRAMLATILYRLAGEPAVSGDMPFTDVAAGQWYTDAVLWAAQNGIVNGLGEDTFAPMNTLTREQLVTMLYRYAEAEGYDVSAAADLSGYPDAGKVQTYAQEAMSWAVAEGIVEGMDDGTLNPAGNATRAQIATILMRFCEGVAQ